MHCIYSQNLVNGKKKEGNHSNISDNYDGGIHPSIRETDKGKVKKKRKNETCFILGCIYILLV